VPQVYAVDDVSFAVRDGEALARGANGRCHA
jgi:hypothetical protein